jgi:hypothetical protein
MRIPRKEARAVKFEKDPILRHCGRCDAAVQTTRVIDDQDEVVSLNKVSKQDVPLRQQPCGRLRGISAVGRL